MEHTYQGFYLGYSNIITSNFWPVFFTEKLTKPQKNTIISLRDHVQRITGCKFVDLEHGFKKNVDIEPDYQR